MEVAITIFTGGSREKFSGIKIKEKKTTDFTVSLVTKATTSANTGTTTETFQLVASILKDVGVGILAAWLYDLLKGKRGVRLIIGREEVEIDQAKITRVLEKKYEESK